MDLMVDRFLDIRLFLWLYLIVSVLFFLGIFLYFNRERIKAKWIKIRWPERVIKVRIIYSGRLIRIFWRLIPDNGDIVIGNQRYFFKEDSLLKQYYLEVDKKDDNILLAKINDKEYRIDKKLSLTTKGDRWPEITFWYNNPNPVDWTETQTGKLTLTATAAEQFYRNKLVEKFLTLKQEQATLMFLLMLVGLNILGTAFIISKLMGWIK